MTGQAAVLTGRILDSECAGVSGAVVDVWYAGGGETRSKNNAVACKHITHTLSFEGNSQSVIGSLVSKADKISLKANA